MSARTAGRAAARRPPPPLLLCFDINKCIIFADTVTNTSADNAIREEVANRFWGHVVQHSAGAGTEDLSWSWTRQAPSLDPPAIKPSAMTAGHDAPGAMECPMTYFSYCKKMAGDKKKAKQFAQTLELIRDEECRRHMTDYAARVSGQMEIPERARTEELATATGLAGSSMLIFPSFFRFIAHLQRQHRHFAVVFRSFGIDLQRVRTEWNAFCERRHPLFNHYLDDIGPMDGSVPGVPDRRIREDDVNTLYRDAAGAILVRNTITNGQEEGDWDKWARLKPKDPDNDTRGGREYIKELGVDTVDGYRAIQSWLAQQVEACRSQMVRDDWAWWHSHGEQHEYGKLMLGVPGVQQIFFDDNVGVDALRIIDPRFSDTFEPVPVERCLDLACLRVDPLSAMLDEHYFIDLYSRPRMHLGVDALSSASLDPARLLGPPDENDVGFGAPLAAGIPATPSVLTGPAPDKPARRAGPLASWTSGPHRVRPLDRVIDRQLCWVHTFFRIPPMAWLSCAFWGLWRRVPANIKNGK